MQALKTIVKWQDRRVFLQLGELLTTHHHDAIYAQVPRHALKNVRYVPAPRLWLYKAPCF